MLFQHFLSAKFCFICGFLFCVVDTGIANEKDWGISLNEHVNESGVNEDGSTWYRESGEDFGENGFRCRWAKMGGQSDDGSSEWKETVLITYNYEMMYKFEYK